MSKMYYIGLRQNFAAMFRDDKEESIKWFLNHHFAPEKKEKNNVTIVENLWEVAVLMVKECIDKNNLVKAKNLLEIFSNYKDTYSTEILESFESFADSLSHDSNSEDQQNVETLAGQIDELHLC